jgi:hypothetical protein
VKGCRREHHGRGLCAVHRQRVRRVGSTGPGGSWDLADQLKDARKRLHALGPFEALDAGRGPIACTAAGRVERVARRAFGVLVRRGDVSALGRQWVAK